METQAQSAYFITGTSTDIGKTWLSCALLRHWRAQGVAVRAVKPVMSGATCAAQNDATALLQAMGDAVSEDAVAAISPWRYAAPLSPDQAAALEGRTLPFDELLAWNRRITSADFQKIDTITLTEGVGGVMVPLTAQHTVLDWMAALAQPVVLVAGSYLGSLSHTLTALLALRARGVSLAAIAVNETPGSAVSLDACVSSLRAHSGATAVCPISRATPDAGVARLAHILHPLS
jgi:dethiobiotin synthetase